MAIFFSSDQHFGHANIIKHCQRPFASLEEMHDFLIRSWNARVRPEDTVYVVGDFSLVRSARIPAVSAILSALPGRKVLIRGNHDSEELELLWDKVHDQVTLNLNGQWVTLNHYPLREWPGMWNGGIHLYGHVHGNLRPLPGSMDVGVDVWGGVPITLEEVLAAVEPFRGQPDKRDHFQIKQWPQAAVSGR